ncbi:MAG: DUF2868 domain-containing protein [Planctomycetes bacterium]|nr:DUF2868 domain-containing protein [Planctomycetota bacterium]
MSRRSQTSPARGSGAPVVFADRLLTESVRALEQDGAAAIDEPQAQALAIESGGGFEQRLVARAGALSIAGELRTSLRRVDRTAATVVAVLVLLALAAGVGAARALLDVPREVPVNFFRLLGGLVGIQTVLLVVWFVVMLVRPSALARGSLGSLALWATRWLAAKFHTGPAHAAAIQAHGVVLRRSPLGRWTLGAISHGAWAAFNVGALVLVVIMLSTGHYLFTWETTILAADTYTPLTRAIAIGPQAAGFPTPSAQQIIEARWPITDRAAAEQAQGAWSGLLIGSVIVYGLLPRLLLLGLCLQRRRRAQARWRLDTSQPGYLRLQARLMPSSASLGIVDHDRAARSMPPATATSTSAHNAQRDVGPPAVLGLEIDTPPATWPPPMDGIAWNDLGFVDDRNDRRRVLDELQASATQPQIMVIVTALTTTPDRGISAFVKQVQIAAGCPVGLVLTGGQALRVRGDAQQMRTRVEDWRALAAAAGVPEQRVVEVDLDHMTQANLAKLADLVGAPPQRPVLRRVEAAFDLILDHYRRWPESPTVKEQAQLHQAIGALYRDEHESWRKLLGAPLDLKGDVTAPFRTSVQRVTNLLPPRLRVDARWMACGALAGALGCVAAATLLSPVAIAALPMWTAIGAAVATATKAVKSVDAEPADGGTTNSAARGDALRAAALFALLLELQGRDEVAITRILDQAIAQDDATDVDALDAARRWLDDMRHRLDLALAKEARL